MNILHICSISNNKASGMSNVIPYHFIYQKKYENVALLNCNKTKIELLNKEKDYYNINEIDSFLDIPCLKKKIDIAIFHGIYIPKYISISRKLKKCGIPYIIVPHGSLTENAQNIKKVKKMLSNVLLFNKFINGAISIQYLSKMEEEMSNKYKKQSFICGNGILKTNKIKKEFDNQGLKIIYVGRYDINQKGIDIIIEGCSLIKEFMKKNHIVINLYGSGDSERKKIELLIKNMHLNSIININNPIFDENKINKILEHDIFIQSSRSEGQPLGIMEAMVLGMPIIISNGTTFANIVKENKCGYIANSPKEISECIVEAYNNKENLKLLSENSYNYANENFLWEDVARSTLKKYKTFIKGEQL